MDQEQLIRIFFDEAVELVDKIERDCLNLESDPANEDIINSIFRSLHTIKGSSSIFGLMQISNLTHDLETAFTELRQNGQVASRQLIDATLGYCDKIRGLLHDPEAAAAAPSSPGESTEQADEESEEKEGMKLFRIYFKPPENILCRGINPYGIFRELHQLGEMRAFAHTKGIPDFPQLKVDCCYLSWNFLISTERDINDIRNCFIFVENDSVIEIELLDDGSNLADTDYKRLGEILEAQHRISADELKAILKEKPLLGELALKKGAISGEDLESALAEQTLVRTQRSKRQDAYEGNTIRVQHGKLDELGNLVGELVILESQLKQLRREVKHNRFDMISDRLGRLVNGLRDNAMSMRMVTLHGLFNTARRLVRDLGTRLNKDVTLRVSGGETELDKNIIESLKDPLIHILRNSIDHGIESSSERKAAGKKAEAEILIQAEHVGAYVEIKISDNGRGIDADKLWKYALRRNLVHEQQKLTRREKLELMFLPGLSSADKTSLVSGRGVGMDVVKKNIEKLRGILKVESEPGEGTRLLMKIPLTLAIIDGLLIKVGSTNFIINISVVEECLEFRPEMISKAGRANIILHRDLLVPYVDMRNLLHIKEELPAIQQIILIKVDGRILGIKVDKVVGKHQTVIKPLSQVYEYINEISGTSILGDGTVALILDTIKIAEVISSQASTAEGVPTV